VKIETGLENYNVYRVRGSVTVVDRVSKAEDFLSQEFVEEFTRQVSPQFAEILGQSVGYLNKNGAEFEFSQYLGTNCVLFNNNLLYLNVSTLLRNYGSSFWCVCSCDKASFDPRTVSNISGLNFEIITELPDDVKKQAYGHMLKWIKETDDPEKKSFYKKYYEEVIKRKRFDDWIEYFKDVLYN